MREGRSAGAVRGGRAGEPRPYIEICTARARPLALSEGTRKKKNTARWMARRGGDRGRGWIMEGLT